MPYLIPIAIMLFGLVAETVIEVSAELSTEVLMDGDAGIDTMHVAVAANRIVDMRPETALAIASGHLPVPVSR